jgi:imidazolonepropionase-like amidohydrolase
MKLLHVPLSDPIGISPCSPWVLRVIVLCAAKALGLAVVLAAPSANAQRAETFDKRVKQYVVHDAPRIRIDNVRVVDGTGAPARTGQSIVIRDGRIERIAASEALAGEAADTVIDGKGRTVVPGLVMMHEHLFFIDVLGEAPMYNSEPFAAPKAYLAFGVTTIRTAGTMHGTDDLETARMIREGKFVGPEVRVTAPFVNGPGSFAFQLRPIADPAEARRIVNFWADEGVSSYKIYQNISREVLAAAIDTAHRRGIKVTGHLCSITFREATEMGIDNLEHGVAVASDFVADKLPDLCPPRDVPEDALLALPPDSPRMKDLIDTLVSHKVAVTSTLAVFAAGIVDWFPGPDDLLMLNHESQTSALRWLARYRGAPERRERALRLLQTEMRFERAFVAAGGTLMAGTDPTGWGGTLPGPGNHAALRLLVEAGFTPLEVIRIATLNGARYQGIDDRVGSLAEGKRADLVLVDGKPDEDIRQLGRIDLVFKDGIAYDSKKIVESLRGKVGR